MQHKLYLLWMAGLALLAAPGMAIEPTDRFFAEGCSITPSIVTGNYPGFTSMPTTNRLAQPPGKAEAAEGQQVLLYGRVLDRNCVPVSEAKVELWQTDPKGRYRYATKPALASAEPIFTGAGRATSDNLGQFFFHTLYPGPYSYSVEREDGSRYTIYRAPHLNVRVTMPSGRMFHTNLFFEGDERNPRDHRLKRLSEARQAQVKMVNEPRYGDVSGAIQARIDIILPDKNQFRKY